MADATPPTSPTPVNELLGSQAFLGDQALGGSTIQVGSNPGDLQAKLVRSDANNTFACTAAGVHRGNTYLVPAGVTYTPVTLPTTTGTGWTRIKSDSASLPPRGTKILTTDTAKLFRIQATTSPHTPVTLPSGSAGWQFIGLDAYSSAVIGPGDLGGDSLLYLLGNRFIAERCYLHANTLTTNFARGVLWMGSDLQLWDTWLQPAGRVKAAGESQAIFFRGIGGARGHIENVELIAPGENIMFNDQYSTVPTTDITFKRCHFWKNKTLWQKWVNDQGVTLNPTWDGNMWVVKNLFESKWAERVWVDGCIFENCWPQIESGTSGQVSAGQDGTAIQIFGGHASENPALGSGRFLVNKDFLFSNCEIVNASAVAGLTTSNGTMGYSGADPTVKPNERIHFVNILARLTGMRGFFFNHAGIDHRLEHFTGVPMDGTTNTPTWGGPRYGLIMTASPAGSWPRLTIKRSVWGGSSFGIRIENSGNAVAVNTANLNTLFGTPGTPTGREMSEIVEFGFGGTGPTGFTYLSNAAAAGINVTTGVLASNSQLKAGQPLGGSDGFDIGVKFAELVAAQTGTSVPNSTFSPLQTPATLTVVFTNTSSAAPFTAHAWTFFATNGTTVLGTSVLPDPSFTYPASGQYNVRHQVTNGNGPGLVVNQAITVQPIGTTSPTFKDVFVAGESGYLQFRIPVLVQLRSGTLLACASARQQLGDAGNNDVVIKRSVDGGLNWGPLLLVWNDGVNSVDNATFAVDRTGPVDVVWLSISRNASGVSSIWTTLSDDDGQTWAPRINQDATLKGTADGIAGGPGAGIQLTSGRLMMPAYYVINSPLEHRGTVFYSDDLGATWLRGGSTPATAPARWNENQVVQLVNGNIMMNIRDNSDPAGGLRGVSISTDGGLTWSAITPQSALPEPSTNRGCNASIIRYSLPADPTGNVLLFSNPAGPLIREKMTIRASYDDGQTWPVAKLLDGGLTQYSSLAVMPDGRIGNLYEFGDPAEKIIFSKFTLGWLTDAVAPTPTITITSQGGGTTFATQTATITLSGTSTNMTSGTWANSAAGASPASGVLTGTSPWSTPVINLVEGPNPITVTGFNIGAPTSASDLITVTYTPPAPTPGAAPVFQAVGTPQAGVGALSVPWPVLQSNDIGLLFVETANEVVATPSGWAIVTNAPQGLGTGGAAGATRLSVFWKRAATSEAAVTVADAGDHQVAFILTARGCNPTGNPWDVTAGDTLTPASSTVTFPSVTTTVVNTLNVYAYAFDNASTDPGVNSAWGTMIRRVLTGTVLGTGGGIAVGTETVAAIGATGTRATAQDVAGIQARMTIALRGVPLGSGAPTIALLTPTTGAPHPTSSTPLTVTGTATDDVAVTSVTWSNDAAGASPASGSAQVTGTTSATWSVTIPLMPGLNGLNFTVHDATAITQSVPLAVTYTPGIPAVLAPPRFMRGFGPVRGVATTDTIQTPLATHVTARTRRAFLRREETALPRTWYTKSTQAIQSLTERLRSATAGGLAVLVYERQWSGGTAGWHFPAPATGARFAIVIKDNTTTPGGSTPIIKINDVVQPLTIVRAPGGGETVVNNAAGYMLGNFPGGAGNAGGDIAKWTVNNYATTDAEDKAFAEGSNPMAAPASVTAPVAYHVLDGTVATEPDAVTSTVSVVTGTLQKDYDPPVVVPPTISLFQVTSGNPAGSVAWQATATTTGPVNRVEFDVDGALFSTRLFAPYLLFNAPQLLGPTPSPHVIVARVYETVGTTAADTKTLNVVEPPAASGSWLVKREICDRVPGADSYKWYIDGSFDQTVLQPATGNPEVIFTFAGADTDKLFEYSSVTGGVESAKAAVRDHFTDPVASAIEGLRETSRTYDGTNWLVSYRWNRKPAPALSYNFYREGSLIENILQPASGNPTYVDTFTGAAVDKTISVSAVYAGPTEGPRAAKKFSYLAPATNAPKGGQELSRVFTP